MALWRMGGGGGAQRVRVIILGYPALADKKGYSVLNLRPAVSDFAMLASRG